MIDNLRPVLLYKIECARSCTKWFGCNSLKVLITSGDSGFKLSICNIEYMCYILYLFIIVRYLGNNLFVRILIITYLIKLRQPSPK